MKNKIKITYPMIANYLGQSLSNINYLKKQHPEKLALYKYGLTYMIENELITMEELKKEKKDHDKTHSNNLINI